MLVFGQKFSIGLVFDWNNVKRDSTLGWLIAVVWLLVAFFTYATPLLIQYMLKLTCVRVIPLLLLVSRSKLVPDFALTIHLLHLIITSVYTRAIPTNLLWWGLQGASAALLVSLGVWACRYREMQPISFPTLPTPNKNKDGKKTEANARAGGPAYEMVVQRDVENQT